HAHGYQRGRNGFGTAHLHGVLTGVIDLVFEHGGRYHLVDYKTNLLPDYGSESLNAAITAYDYDAHIGEVYYLFLRGLREGKGVHRDRPPRELIGAMDALFDGELERAA